MLTETHASKKSIAMRKKVYGVGVNDSKFIVCAKIDRKVIKCPYYTRWTNMLQRCYCESFKIKKPVYRGCRVSNSWLLFSTFKLWMEKQDWQGKHLDKDILFQGNKLYSEGTCIFVDHTINTLLVKKQENKKGGKTGTSLHRLTNKFESCYYHLRKKIYIGLFDDEGVAHQHYCEHKYKLIAVIAEAQSEPLKSALLNYKISEY